MERREMKNEFKLAKEMIRESEKSGSFNDVESVVQDFKTNYETAEKEIERLERKLNLAKEKNSKSRI